MTPSKKEFGALRQRYETELFRNVLPFWQKHSPDREFGGYFNCLDRDGRVYDTSKYIWLQGREAWIFSKLHREVEARPEWLEMAKLGIDFLRKHALRSDGRVYFRVARDGKPVYLQRKPFSECFYVMALAEYARAARKPELLTEAKAEFEKIWELAFHPEKLGRPAMPGETPLQSLAVPMILLNLIEELTDGDAKPYQAQVEECLRRMLLHVNRGRQTVFENVAPNGALVDTPEGRLLNPGHAIEAGWFLQHWARRLGREDLSRTAVNMVRWSHRQGWDREFGGFYYFLDAGGYSPVQLEWNMKLWWPHTEALYAHLLNYSITREAADWEAFEEVDRYAFARFPDPEFGEWYGYLNRQGEVSQRFKGGPYKCCFHVPRALWLCVRLLRQLEN